MTGGPAQQHLSAELSDLATGSDREIMDSYRYLDELCKGLSARDATYPRILMTRNVRDLFAKALQRMNELPPDPRETLHAKAPKTPDIEQPRHISTTGRGVSQPIALRERTARVHVKPHTFAAVESFKVQETAKNARRYIKMRRQIHEHPALA